MIKDPILLGAAVGIVLSIASGFFLEHQQQTGLVKQNAELKALLDTCAQVSSKMWAENEDLKRRLNAPAGAPAMVPGTSPSGK